MKISKRKVFLKEKEEVFEYSLSNNKGMEINILTLGGIITDIKVPDSNGIVENVVVKWKDLNDYIDDSGYTGAIIGRNSGRIADGKVIIGDKTYELTKNQGVNILHGGNNGFNKKIWKDSISENENEVSLILETYSNDGEENFPGNLKVKVVYSLNNENEFSINYYGISDKDTILNMTNHSYFNLSGDMKRNILDENLIVSADKIATIRQDSALSGELINVKDTPFNFNSSKAIGKDIQGEHEQIGLGNGYDHPWILNQGDGYNIKLEDDISGRVMEIYTDRKAVVIYSTNFPENKELFTGRKLSENDAICFETQNLPIAKDCKFIEDSLIKKGQEYSATTMFKFYCK